MLDAPTRLADGTEVELELADDAPAMNDAERAALNAALSRAWASAQAGRMRPAADVLRDLDAGR